MKVTITGGCGRFGAVVLSRLTAQGHELHVLDRQAPKSTLPGGATFEQSDLMDAAWLRNRFAGQDAVVHLAAIPHPLLDPPEHVYANNTVGSYNVLIAAAEAGVRKVCQASSINAIGGAWSRVARYDYFPVDEAHPTYNEDAYSLSKWVAEAQADSVARMHSEMTITSLRLHGLAPGPRVEHHDAVLMDVPAEHRFRIVNHLWAYVNIESAAHAVELSLQAQWRGHQAFFIVAPRTIFNPEIASAALAFQHYPTAALRAPLDGNTGFYDCAKAERLLGWVHHE
ncbi:MAG: NAD(P)-dependent oxidoreductase [Chloroflexi bacterium]|nr:NAD(P)-dependent oxidoreductase [Chloroflexota bacterium]